MLPGLCIFLRHSGSCGLLFSLPGLAHGGRAAAGRIPFPEGRFKNRLFQPFQPKRAPAWRLNSALRASNNAARARVSTLRPKRLKQHDFFTGPGRKEYGRPLYPAAAPGRARGERGYGPKRAGRARRPQRDFRAREENKKGFDLVIPS